MEPLTASAAAGAAIDIVARLLTAENLGMSGAIWLLLELLRRSVPALFEKGIFRRLLPVLPETIGVGSYWLIPTLAAPGASLGERLLVGFVVGSGSSKLHSVVRQTVFGKDKMIEAERERKAKAKAKAKDKPADGDDGADNG